MGRNYEGKFDAHGKRIAIVASRFNDFFTGELLAGAQDCLRRHGVADEQVDTAWVPGGFELPMAAKKLAQSGRYAAVICVGCIIQGDTPHWAYISNELTKGIAQVGLESSIPVVYGVVTAETLDQAIERAGTKAGNKGVEAAMSALEMVSALRRLGP